MGGKEGREGRSTGELGRGKYGGNAYVGRERGGEKGEGRNFDRKHANWDGQHRNWSRTRVCIWTEGGGEGGREYGLGEETRV